MITEIKVDELTDQDHIGILLMDKKWKVDWNDAMNGYSAIVDDETLEERKKRWISNSKKEYIKKIYHQCTELKWFLLEEDLNNWLKKKL